MISYVTQEAATDDRLTPTALRLLIYLGGVNPHIGGWSNAHLSELAHVLHVDVRSVHGARHQLVKYGYLAKRIGMVQRMTRKGEPLLRRHHFYRTVSEVQATPHARFA